MRTKWIAALLIMFANTLMAQQKRFTLNDLLGGGSTYWQLQPERRYTKWWGNKALETTPECVNELESGKPLFTVSQINEWAGENLLRSGHNVAFPYADQPLLLLQARNKYVLVDFKAQKPVWSLSYSREARNQDWNAVSRNLAYTEKGNLYVQTAEGEVHQVSTDGSVDGSDNIIYGQTVHRNEFGIDKGTFWSPDGKRLAFYRMDQSMVPSYPQVDITQRIATTYTDHYPMAGEASHQVKVGVYDVTTKQTTYLQLVGAAEDYHTNLSWSPDGKTLYIFELNRAQNHMRLVAYNALTGKFLSTLLEETSEKYVEPQHGLTFLPWDATRALMQSQKDGYNHLYLLTIEGNVVKSEKQLTKGNWVVQQFVGFNEKKRSIVYLSNESDPRRSCVYSLNLKSGVKTLIGAEDGVHRVALSADGTQLIDEYTSPTVPRSINLCQTHSGKAENLLTAADPWKEKGYNIPEITSGSIVAADGKTPLYYRMVKPVNFDATKKYPTVVYVYGGPHAHNVDARWHWGLRGWEAYMAQLGYLVFVLDNRGSEWRGRDFEQSTHKHLGDVEMQDQMEGVKFLKSLPYVDATRLGVHGWSFGGFMTTNLMCSYPDVFKVGVAGGPVIDWKYYEVMYGERYMSTPQKNPEGYAGSSLLNKAKNLKGRLQIILGYNDPVCVPQHTLSFMRACIDAGTQPDLFMYPGSEHNMAGTDQIHLHERITRYFEDYLK